MVYSFLEESLLILFISVVSIATSFSFLVLLSLLPFFLMSLNVCQSCVSLQRINFKFHRSFYCFFISISFISALIFMISFILITLGFLFSLLVKGVDFHIEVDTIMREWYRIELLYWYSHNTCSITAMLFNFENSSVHVSFSIFSLPCLLQNLYISHLVEKWLKACSVDLCLCVYVYGGDI